MNLVSYILPLTVIQDGRLSDSATWAKLVLTEKPKNTFSRLDLKSLMKAINIENVTDVFLIATKMLLYKSALKK
jgi:hypothetical protein